MRTETTTRTLYTFDELSDEAKERAIEHRRDIIDRSGDTPWSGEIIDSFKAVFRMAGVTIRDYQIGGRGTDVTFRMDDEVCALKGARAIAWLENNLLFKLRCPWTTTRSHLAKLRSYKNIRVTPESRFRTAFCMPGTIEGGNLTGYCADDDFIDSLRSDVRSGMTLGDAFSALADVAARLIEQEKEAERSDEAIIERLQDGHEFTEDGRLV